MARKSKADAAGSDKIPKIKGTRRSTSVKKSIPRKKSAIRIPREVVAMSVEFHPTDEQISMRAYFISERRRRLALPGDANSDWIEARRQLLTETRH